MMTAFLPVYWRFSLQRFDAVPYLWLLLSPISPISHRARLQVYTTDKLLLREMLAHPYFVDINVSNHRPSEGTLFKFFRERLPDPTYLTEARASLLRLVVAADNDNQSPDLMTEEMYAIFSILSPLFDCYVHNDMMSSSRDRSSVPSGDAPLCCAASNHLNDTGPLVWPVDRSHARFFIGPHCKVASQPCHQGRLIQSRLNAILNVRYMAWNPRYSGSLYT